MDNKVKQPSYYTAPSGLTVKRVIMDFSLNFPLGSAIKYILRAGKKDVKTEVQDLEKAIESIRIHLDHLKEPAQSDWAGLASYASGQPLIKSPMDNIRANGKSLVEQLHLRGFSKQASAIESLINEVLGGDK